MNPTAPAADSLPASELIRDPFVGPRPFTRADAWCFFGRDFETRALTSLLIAERIVLLYSPSGAGKTSLVQARLLDALERHRFEPLPVIRLNCIPTPGELPRYSGNRYIESTLRSLDLPAEGPGIRSDPSVLASYLNVRPQRERKGEVLIFDQFEEVFTLDPADLEAKAQFFAAIETILRTEECAMTDAAAQRLRRRWVLFALREEYLAELDPYLTSFPNRLSATFRLNLLDRNKAVAAVQGPARAGGVEVEESAASWLFDQLCQRHIHRPGQEGLLTVRRHYVDPVQLQIVCQRLWNNLPVGQTHLTEADLQALPAGTGAGVVDAMLQGYYVDVLKMVVTERGGRVKEQDIRLWIDQYLITYNGLRGQVLEDSAEAQRVPEEARQALIDAAVLRREERNGAFWLELAHDRLIRPIKLNNDAWYEAHLSPLQLAARAWEKAKKRTSLLPRGPTLIEADEWARQHPDQLTPLDREFLEAGKGNQRWVRRFWMAIGLTAFVLLAAVAISLYALREHEISQQERLKSQQERLNYWAALAQGKAAIDPELALFMAVQASEDPHVGSENRALEEAFVQILARCGGQPLPGHEGAVSTIAVTDHWIATGGLDTKIHLWQKEAALQGVAKDFGSSGPGRATLQLACIDSLNMPRRIAATGGGHKVHLFEVNEDDQLDKPVELSGPTTFSDFTVFFSDQNGSLWLCTGGQDQYLCFWKLEDIERCKWEAYRVQGHAARLSAMAINKAAEHAGEGIQRDRFLVTASKDGTIRLWFLDELMELIKKLDKGKPLPPPPATFFDVQPLPCMNTPAFMGAAFCSRASEHGKPTDWLVTAGPDQQGTHKVSMWRVDELKKQRGNLPDDGRANLFCQLVGHDPTTSINTLAVDPHGRMVVTGDNNGLLYRWSLPNPDRSQLPGRLSADCVKPTSTGTEHAIIQVAISPNAQWIASGHFDGTAVIYDAAQLDRGRTHYKLNLGKPIRSFALGTSQRVGDFLVTGTDDGRVRAWKLNQLKDEIGELKLNQRPPMLNENQKASRVDTLRKKYQSLEALADVGKRLIERKKAENHERWKVLREQAEKELPTNTDSRR